MATGCSQRPDWANGSYSAAILALGTRISPKLPIPKASESGPLSMCKAIKRNVCGYKTSAHIPKPHRTMNPGLFRVKNLPFAPTSPLAYPETPCARRSLQRIISKRIFPDLPSQPAFPDLLLSSRSEPRCANISLGTQHLPLAALLDPKLHKALELPAPR